MDFANTRFSKEHEWVAFEPSSKMVSIGITDFASEELGDIVYIELPGVGQKVTIMETMGTIEAVKTVADLFAPISGVVKEVNTRLEDNPELVNQHPYEEGWFMKVEMNDEGELEKLMSHEEYQKMIGRE
jgi:glycine cleavage system H protein